VRLALAAAQAAKPPDAFVVADAQRFARGLAALAPDRGIKLGAASFANGFYQIVVILGGLRCRGMSSPPAAVARGQVVWERDGSQAARIGREGWRAHLLPSES
jgi:hypothetical protein